MPMSVKKSKSAKKRVRVKDRPAETKLTGKQMKKVKGGLISQKGALMSLGGSALDGTKGGGGAK